MMPVYNNLVLFNPMIRQERMDTIIPELAMSWLWENGGKQLTFSLRRDVKWHDGRPFTAKDVKHTFDVVRGASDQRLKLNPRKLWYFNVEAIVANGDYEVTFRLKRPQPSLLAILASGYSPVYPAHIAPRDIRTTAVGTGPFRLIDYKRDHLLKYRRNTDYFVKDRPYLDGIDMVIIRTRSSRMAALQANQVDMSIPYDVDETSKKQLAGTVPELVFDLSSSNVSDNIIMNTNRPPFDNPRLRRAVAHAVDRDRLIKLVHQGLGIKGGAMLPRPYGVWGLPEDELSDAPGMGPSATEKEKGRQIMRELGYGPNMPLNRLRKFGLSLV